MKRLDVAAWAMGTCLALMTIWVFTRCADKKEPVKLPPIVSAEPVKSAEPEKEAPDDWTPAKLEAIKGQWQGKNRSSVRITTRDEVPSDSGSIYPWKIRIWVGGDAAPWPIECGFYPKSHEKDGTSFRVAYCVGGSFLPSDGGSYAKRLTLETDGIHLRVTLGSELTLELEPRHSDAGQ